MTDRSHGNRGPSMGRVWAEENATHSQHANTLYASTVYTHIPHNRIQISEITLLGHVCKAATLTLNKIFWHSKIIYLYLVNKINNNYENSN